MNAKKNPSDAAPNASQKPTAADALALATEKWKNGERIDVGAIANELGVAKATLFRWVGNRDLLTGEVIWNHAKLAIQIADTQVTATGINYVANYSYWMMKVIAGFKPLQNYIQADTERALHILTGTNSLVHARFVNEVQTRLQQQIADGHLTLQLEAKETAYLIVRIAEAVLYSEHRNQQTPKLDLMRDAVRFLLLGQQTAN